MSSNSKKRFILGVTGPFASGKSTVTAYLKKRGWTVLDADRFGHQALKQTTIRRKLANKFGRSILDRRSEIDRSVLGKIVFNNKSHLRYLEKTVHPWMLRAIKEAIRTNENPKLAIDAALLFRMDLAKRCDKILLVTAPKRILIERGMKRNGMSQERITSILKRQTFPKRKSTITISNTGNKKTLLQKTEEFLKKNLRDFSAFPKNPLAKK